MEKKNLKSFPVRVTVLPIIYTYDVFNTLRFYSALGFDYDYDYHDTGKNWSILRWGDMEVMVALPDRYDHTHENIGKTHLYIKITEMDEWYKYIRYVMEEAYGHYISDIRTNNDRGHREFFVYDNNRNTITFGEALNIG